MVTINQRPESCRLSDTVNQTYSISNGGYGTAVLSGGSGLNNGDKILVANSLDSYNGFWILTAIGPNVFTLRRYTGGATLTYTADSTPDIYPCSTTVIWSCAHLPITYKLSSNLYPTNTSDSIRGVTGFANDNGFVRLTLSGSITAEVGDWLNISATSDDDLDGPFQVLTKWSPTQFTISAPYSLAALSPYTYATATAQKYYNNYHVRIRIYAGLPSGHTWQALKPYQLITELKLVPNEDGQILLNVAEAVKERLEIRRNRPNYDSMPYDLDRFTGFYIEYAESYDVQGESFTDSYTSDFVNFQGFAADAMLEFKNRYSGSMSKYVGSPANASLAEFLTTAETPVYFPGYYFDVSVITVSKEVMEAFIGGVVDRITLIQQEFDENDNQIDVFQTHYTPYESEGIVRIPVVVTSQAAYIKIAASIGTTVSAYTLTALKRVDVSRKCYAEYIYLTWKNPLGGFDYFVFTGNKDYNINILGVEQKIVNIYPDWDKSYGEFADTITYESARSSKREMIVRSQNLTRDQLDYVVGIRLSSLVQQLTSKYDRRTFLVDGNSFKIRSDEEKTVFSIQFTIQETNDIASQSV